MDEKDLKEVGAAVRAEADEIKKAVSGEMAEKFEAVKKEVGDVKAELIAKMHEGASPIDQKVKDLESKLTEQQEEIRMLRANPVLPSNAKPDKDPFAGLFVRNIGELRKIFAQRQTHLALGGGDDIAVRALDSGLFTTGGQLSGETASRFLDFVIAKQRTLSRIQNRRMTADTAYIDRLTLTARATRKGAEGTEPTVADSVGTDRHTLTVVECIYPEDITLQFLEENIERANAESHIAEIIGKAVGNDQNDLAWNGEEEAQDSAGRDDFLSINDGFLHLFKDDADVNDVDAAALTTVTAMLENTLNAMPDEFAASEDLAFFLPRVTAQIYAQEVGDRATPLGDQVLVNGFPNLRYFGIPVIPEFHLTADELVLSPLQNLVYGVRRIVTLDSEWKPRKRLVEYTVTLKSDYEYATGEAVVLTDNIPADLR